MPPEATDREAAVRGAFAKQAEWCAALGSPFTSVLCAAAAERLDGASVVGRHMLDWPGRPDAGGDSVPLRFAGALNGLVRDGAVPDLARLYPPNPLPEPAALWPAVVSVLSSREAEILRWLESAPQTNEVARSAVLMSGLLQVAAETGLPLALFELGASAGLNLCLDRYAYRLGDLETGPADAPLRLAPAWEGADPPSAAVHVVSRAGVDLAPLDAASPRDRARLLAYVWPDQAERIARIEAALGVAALMKPRVDRADAAGWLEGELARPSVEGVARVVQHSIAFQYFPAATQARIAARMEEAGAASSVSSPLAWLRYEIDPELGGRSSLRLRIWPCGADRRLAIADPHARHVSWGT